MNFTDNKPIYRQIVDFAFNEVTAGRWIPGMRIPSVRELSADLGVNSRTVLKAFEDLQDLGLITSQRGMGYFLTADARQRVNAERRRMFFETTVPGIAAEMQALGITAEQLADHVRGLLENIS